MILLLSLLKTAYWSWDLVADAARAGLFFVVWRELYREPPAEMVHSGKSG